MCRKLSRLDRQRFWQSEFFTAATLSIRIGLESTKAQPVIRALPTRTSIPNPDPTRLYIIEKIEEFQRLIPTPTPFDMPTRQADSIEV